MRKNIERRLRVGGAATRAACDTGSVANTKSILALFDRPYTRMMHGAVGRRGKYSSADPMQLPRERGAL